MCSWHVLKAIRDHLGKSNAYVFAEHGSHAPIYYDDADLWGQDASFLDTAWVEQQNNLNEENFVREARGRCPVGGRIIEEGNKPTVCCPHEPYRKAICEMVDRHLHYHPLTGARPEDQRAYLGRDKWEFWRGQVTEMHDYCKEKGLSWVWEYMWKQWYNPRQ
jgi:hypothetical protein